MTRKKRKAENTRLLMSIDICETEILKNGNRQSKKDFLARKQRLVKVVTSEWSKVVSHWG